MVFPKGTDIFVVDEDRHPMALFGFAILVIVFLIPIVFGSQVIPNNLLVMVIPGVIASLLLSIGLIFLLIARLAFKKEKIFAPMFSLEEKKHEPNDQKKP